MALSQGQQGVRHGQARLQQVDQGFAVESGAQHDLPVATARGKDVQVPTVITSPDQEIVVMADTGEVWQGAGAWVLCLWALREYRGWSARLASPAMQAAARKVVHWISRNRIA